MLGVLDRLGGVAKPHAAHVSSYANAASETACSAMAAGEANEEMDTEMVARAERDREPRNQIDNQDNPPAR